MLHLCKGGQKERYTDNGAASVTSNAIMHERKHYVSLYRFKRDIAIENQSVDHKLKSNSQKTKKLGKKENTAKHNLKCLFPKSYAKLCRLYF